MICFEWPAGLLVAPFSDYLFLKTAMNGLEVSLAKFPEYCMENFIRAKQFESI